MTDEVYNPHDLTQTGLKSRLARRLAMQVLFVWDAAGRPDDVEAEHVTAEATRGVDPNDPAAMSEAHAARQRAQAAARGVWIQWESINASLERIAPQWPPRRMPAVDRAILRLATWELTNTPTPPKVVIDEAIELAKEFSTVDSPRFVNGVLDKVLREREELLGEKTGDGRQEPESRTEGGRMQPVDRFEKLIAWEKAHQWVIKIYAQTKGFPPEEQFGITNQLRRASASVPANIVEGFNRTGIRDKLKFYNTARASLEEARYFLLLAHDLGFGDTRPLRADAEEIARVLHGLIVSTEGRL